MGRNRIAQQKPMRPYPHLSWFPYCKQQGCLGERAGYAPTLKVLRAEGD